MAACPTSARTHTCGHAMVAQSPPATSRRRCRLTTLIHCCKPSTKQRRFSFFSSRLLSSLYSPPPLLFILLLLPPLHPDGELRPSHSGPPVCSISSSLIRPCEVVDEPRPASVAPFAATTSSVTASYNRGPAPTTPPQAPCRPRAASRPIGHRRQPLVQGTTTDSPSIPHVTVDSSSGEFPYSRPFPNLFTPPP
jgi:hypothetical protein